MELFRTSNHQNFGGLRVSFYKSRKTFVIVRESALTTAYCSSADDRGKCVMTPMVRPCTVWRIAAAKVGITVLLLGPKPVIQR